MAWMYFLLQFQDQGQLPYCAFGMIWCRCFGSIYAQFDDHNAGNSVSELPDFKFFWGEHDPDPLRCSKLGKNSGCPEGKCRTTKPLDFGCPDENLVMPNFFYDFGLVGSCLL